ncbi:MAG: CopG family transcriptional regulator [Gemmatimonadetes bacterium]|nr:CopG family transcriptional regulator [Gemmatimonadota bacterium]
MKRNVTITLDEHTARWARVEAARRDTSVSDYVGSLLRERMQQDLGYERAMAAWLALEPVALKRSGRYPTREAVHERGLR